MDLHLSGEEFWALTPRQFSELLKRQREHNEFQELLTGIVASAVANFSFGARKKPLTPAHFMPSQRDRVAETKKMKQMTRKRVADEVRAIFGR